jgi:hypothetical protein
VYHDLPTRSDYEAVLAEVRDRADLSDREFDALRRDVRFRVSDGHLVFELLGTTSWGPYLDRDEERRNDAWLCSLTERLTAEVKEKKHRAARRGTGTEQLPRSPMTRLPPDRRERP